MDWKLKDRDSENKCKTLKSKGESLENGKYPKHRSYTMRPNWVAFTNPMMNSSKKIARGHNQELE